MRGGRVVITAQAQAKARLGTPPARRSCLSRHTPQLLHSRWFQRTGGGGLAPVYTVDHQPCPVRGPHRPAAIAPHHTGPFAPNSLPPTGRSPHTRPVTSRCISWRLALPCSRRGAMELLRRRESAVCDARIMCSIVMTTCELDFAVVPVMAEPLVPREGLASPVWARPDVCSGPHAFAVAACSRRLVGWQLRAGAVPMSPS